MKYAQSVEGFYILLLHSREQVYNNKISEQLFYHVLGSTKLCFLLCLRTNLGAISLAKGSALQLIQLTFLLHRVPKVCGCNPLLLALRYTIYFLVLISLNSLMKMYER